MDLGLKGKVALVGGASRGLGRAVAEELAGEGCAVVLCSRDADAVARAAVRLRFCPLVFDGARRGEGQFIHTNATLRTLLPGGASCEYHS